MAYGQQQREAWLADLAAEGNMTVEQVLAERAARGQHPEPCFCDWSGCTGWAWSERRDSDG